MTETVDKEAFDFWEFLALRCVRENPRAKVLLLNMSKFALDYCQHTRTRTLDFEYWFGNETSDLSHKLARERKNPFIQYMIKPIRRGVRRLRNWLQEIVDRRKGEGEPPSFEKRLNGRASLIFLRSLRHFCRRFAQDMEQSGTVGAMDTLLEAYKHAALPETPERAALQDKFRLFNHGQDVWPDPHPQHWQNYPPEVEAMIRALYDDDVTVDTAIAYGCNLFFAGTQFMYAAEMLGQIETDSELVNLVQQSEEKPITIH